MTSTLASIHLYVPIHRKQLCALRARLCQQIYLIPSTVAYMDIPYLKQLPLDHEIDTIHPGYGCLSDSAAFAYRTWNEARVIVIGPEWEAS